MDFTGAASRESLDLATRGLDDFIDSADPDELARMADEVFATVALLDRQPGLRRALADPAADPDRRAALLERLLGGKVGDSTLRAAPPAGPLPLVRAGRPGRRDRAARPSGGARGGRARGALDDVEDELFRFGRIWTASRAAAALENRTADRAPGRAARPAAR